MTSPSTERNRLTWAGYLLGFGLGGFFDGVLLHQVLQWHHLLSLVDSPMLDDLRSQVLADGLFHVLMYLFAAAGLWQLWRSRSEFARPGADRWLLGSALIGFAVWHILDSVLSHWVLGIHRIKIDSPNPLLWDLIWFFAFGVVVLIAGLRVRRRAGGTGPGQAGRTAAALTLAALVAGPWTAMPPPTAQSAVVLFSPGTGAARAFSAVAAVDGRVMWADRSGELLAVDLAAPDAASKLYRHGALLVSSSFLGAGCLAWSKA